MLLQGFSGLVKSTSVLFPRVLRACEVLISPISSSEINHPWESFITDKNCRKRHTGTSVYKLQVDQRGLLLQVTPMVR